MKLEIKHLASYLPYDLKCKDIPKGFEGIRKLDINTFNWCLENGKPILFPFSSLTKEITVNGETFIPIKKIFLAIIDDYESYENIYFKGNLDNIKFGCYNTAHASGNGLFLNIHIQNNFIIKVEYGEQHRAKSDYHIKFLQMQTLMELLLEWKFDVFGLIDAGLAEPITEDFNPYK